MIGIFTTQFSPVVQKISDLASLTAQPTVVIGQKDSLKDAILKSQSKVLFLIGDTSEMKQLVAETFELTVMYDKHLESQILEYCLKADRVRPNQLTLDKLCALPESFKNFSPENDFQSASFGEFNKRFIYIMSNNCTQATWLFDTYIKKTLSKLFSVRSTVYKIFALSKPTILAKLNLLENKKYVSHLCETYDDCDFRVVAKFNKSASESFILQHDAKIKKLFGAFLYSDYDTTLQREVVSVLQELKKRLAIAESLTGGIISGKVVDIAGASKVLYEGLVVYTADAKSNRLAINPFFIDKFGVVSSEVASTMAENLLKISSADYSISVTGYADSIAQSQVPVGLCFIAIGTKRTVKVYKLLFGGDRQQIRNQVANSSLFLLLATLKNINIDEIN